MSGLKQWMRQLLGCVLVLSLCMNTPLQAQCGGRCGGRGCGNSGCIGLDGCIRSDGCDGCDSCDCNACDGCGGAYSRGRVCQVAGGWVIGGVIVGVIAAAIFGRSCHKHHCHLRNHEQSHKCDCKGI